MRAFLFVIAALSFFTASAEVKDSVGLKKVNGKNFIEHKVDKGQTLYSLTKRYGVTVDELYAANPELSKGLKVGQTLLIPTKQSVPAETEPKPAEVKPVENNNRPAENSDLYVYHEVKAGETLSKLSRDYKVPVGQIKEWNNLGDQGIKPGQRLIVGEKKSPLRKGEPKPGDPGAGAGAGNKKTPPKKTVDANGEMNEQGKAAVISDPTIDQERNFCFHPTAPVGTIIMVTNTANNQSVFVRVQGNFDSASTGLAVQLSRAAIKKIGGSSEGFTVKLNYAR